MRGYLWRGDQPQCYLNCVVGRLSFPDVCRFYWCLLFSTAGRHGKKLKTEKEVKGKQQGEGFLVLMNRWGFAFVFNWRGEKPDSRRWRLLSEAKTNFFCSPSVTQQVLICSAAGLPAVFLYKWCFISWNYWHFWEINFGQILWLFVLFFYACFKQKK